MKQLLIPVLAGFLLVTPALADPGAEETVAIVNGKTYTYGEMEPPREWVEMTAKYNKGESFDKALRTKAAADLRSKAAMEILAKKNPDCDLDATDEEAATFLAWWQKSSREILDAQIAQTQASGRQVQISGAWNNLDEINPGNAQAVAAASEKIETWKVNKCVYQSYGGGRVHQNLGLFAFMQPGETLISAYEGLAGYPYPVVVSNGTPLNGYISFFEAAKADGSISFPDARYEELFFSYYRNETLRSFPEADEEASITTRYWENPVVQPKL